MGLGGEAPKRGRRSVLNALRNHWLIGGSAQVELPARAGGARPSMRIMLSWQRTATSPKWSNAASPPVRHRLCPPPQRSSRPLPRARRRTPPFQIVVSRPCTPRQRGASAYAAAAPARAAPPSTAGCCVQWQTRGGGGGRVEGRRLAPSAHRVSALPSTRRCCLSHCIMPAAPDWPPPPPPSAKRGPKVLGGRALAVPTARQHRGGAARPQPAGSTRVWSRHAPPQTAPVLRALVGIAAPVPAAAVASGAPLWSGTGRLDTPVQAHAPSSDGCRWWDRSIPQQPRRVHPEGETHACGRAAQPIRGGAPTAGGQHTQQDRFFF